MPYDMQSGYVPGGGYQATARPGAVPVQGNQEVLDFLRQMSLMKQRPTGDAPGGGGAGAAGVYLKKAPTRADEGNAEFARQMQQVQLGKAQGELNDANSIRNMRKVPVQMGNGMYGVAYDWDVRSATPAQQRAVSPENSVVANEGLTSGEASKIAGAGERAKRGEPEPGSYEAFVRDVQMRQQIARQGGL